METDNSLPVGYRLQEYRIEGLLGVGGFGLTYLATDSNLNLKVAIKEYLPEEFATRAEDHSVHPKSGEAGESFQWGKQRFIDESRTLASFRHPNIVRVMRFFEANQTAYMVMEFVAGSSLPDWMKSRRPLDQAALQNIVLPVLDGLAVVHKSRYLHRDIKPANIYMRDDGTPVLLDFGSARMSGGGNELTAIVTPGYAPFEQYHSHGNQGAWSDLYAIGGVLYWMVTGSKPIEAAARLRKDPLPPATQVGDKNLYKLDFLSAIDWALNPHEDGRPQSVADFRVVLSGDENLTMSFEDTQELTVPTSLADPMPAAAAAPQPMTGLTSLPTGVVFDRETLKKIEADLVRHIGPIAAVVIRNAAKKTATVPALAELVASEISDEKARADFVKKFSSFEHSQPVSAPSQPASAGNSQYSGFTQLARARFSQDVLDRAEKRLAQYLGAIAKVVVKRAAAKARDEGELYLLIADEIDDKKERNAFVRLAISVPRNGSD